MAVDVDSYTDSGPFGPPSPWDYTHTVPANTPCLVVMFAYGWNTGNNYDPPLSVTWDNAGVAEALTFCGRTSHHNGSGWGGVEMWVKWNPTAGATKNIRVVWNDSPPSQCIVMSFNLTGVDQTRTGTLTSAYLQWGATNPGSGDHTVTFDSGTIPVEPGDLIIGGWFDDEGGASDLTEIGSPNYGAIYEDLGAGDSDGAIHAWKVTGTSKTVGYNSTTGINGDMQLIAWRFRGPASGLPPHARGYGPDRNGMFTALRM